MFSCGTKSSNVKNNKDCKTLTIGTTTAIIPIITKRLTIGITTPITPTRTKTLSIGTNNTINTNKNKDTINRNKQHH